MWLRAAVRVLMWAAILVANFAARRVGCPAFSGHLIIGFSGYRTRVVVLVQDFLWGSVPQ
jgi:hypothetical protein